MLSTSAFAYQSLPPTLEFATIKSWHTGRFTVSHKAAFFYLVRIPPSKSFICLIFKTRFGWPVATLALTVKPSSHKSISGPWP